MMRRRVCGGDAGVHSCRVCSITEECVNENRFVSALVLCLLKTVPFSMKVLTEGNFSILPPKTKDSWNQYIAINFNFETF